MKLKKIFGISLLSFLLFTPFAHAVSTNDCYSTDTGVMLFGEGADTSTTITDSSTNGFTITANGNCQIDTGQFKFGAASIQFDGTGDYFTIPDNAIWDMAGDFTIRFWIRITNDAIFQEIFGSTSATTDWIDLYYDKGGGGQYILDMMGTGAFSGAWNLVNDTWHHIEIDKSGSSVYFFFDGTQSGSTHTNSTSQTLAGNIQVGNTEDGIGDLNGHIDDFQIIPGLALHTGNFTPPAAALTDCDATLNHRIIFIS